MALTREQIKVIVRDYFKDKPVERVYLFGSYAQGKETEGSDVDILFDFEKGARISYFGLAKYLVDLEEKLNKKVDLVEGQTLYPRVKELVDATKVLIYSK